MTRSGSTGSGHPHRAGEHLKLLMAVIVSTAVLQAPQHARLAQGFDSLTFGVFAGS